MGERPGRLDALHCEDDRRRLVGTHPDGQVSGTIELAQDYHRLSSGHVHADASNFHGYVRGGHLSLLFEWTEGVFELGVHERRGHGEAQ